MDILDVFGIGGRSPGSRGFTPIIHAGYGLFQGEEITLIVRTQAIPVYTDSVLRFGQRFGTRCIAVDYE